MIMTFRADKMIERVKREGMEHMLDEDTLAYIRSLDGFQGDANNWRATVYGEPLVWLPAAHTYVNIADCD